MVGEAYEVKSRASRKEVLRLPMRGTMKYGRFLKVWKPLLITSRIVLASVQYS